MRTGYHFLYFSMAQLYRWQGRAALGSPHLLSIIALSFFGSILFWSCQLWALNSGYELALLRFLEYDALGINPYSAVFAIALVLNWLFFRGESDHQSIEKSFSRLPTSTKRMGYTISFIVVLADLLFFLFQAHTYSSSR